MTNDSGSKRKRLPVCTGPRERISQMWIRMRQLEGTPHYVAVGLSVGVFISFMPIIPFQTVVAIALAFLVRGSKSAAVLGTWLSNPLTIPLVYYLDYQLGCVLLGNQATLKNIEFESFSELMELGLEVTWAMIVGSLVIGGTFSLIAYIVTFHAFKTLRKRSPKTPTIPKAGP